MERRRGSGVASFFVDAAPAAGATLRLSAAGAAHARVRRLAVGSEVRLSDGVGHVGWGTLQRIDARAAEVAVHRTEVVPRPLPLTLLVPVADRDRTLWLAEKAVELAATEWIPVWYARSRSVSSRGEGAGFARKLRARMVGALEQSGGAWLPDVREPVEVESAVAVQAEADVRLVLHAGGERMGTLAPFHGVAVVVGPEGGLEAEELERFLERGWRAASLGTTTLRFETAGVAALAIIRSSQGR